MLQIRSPVFPEHPVDNWATKSWLQRRPTPSNLFQTIFVDSYFRAEMFPIFCVYIFRRFDRLSGLRIGSLGAFLSWAIISSFFLPNFLILSSPNLDSYLFRITANRHSLRDTRTLCLLFYLPLQLPLCKTWDILFCQKFFAAKLMIPGKEGLHLNLRKKRVLASEMPRKEKKNAITTPFLMPFAPTPSPTPSFLG